MSYNNFTNLLVGILVVAMLLTGYNAFIATSDDDSATSRLTSYLNISNPENVTFDGTVPAEEDEVESVEVTSVPADESTDNEAVETQEEVVTSEAPVEPEEERMANGDSSERSSVQATTYAVKAGDTYGCIAEQIYGSLEHYVDLMSANPINQIGFAERYLHVGAEIVVPAISAENLKPVSSLCGA